MLEEDERVGPALVGDLLRPLREIRFPVRRPPQAQVAPACRANELGCGLVIDVGQAKSTAVLAKGVEDLVVEPRFIAELEGGAGVVVQQLEELLKSRQVLLEVGGS